MRQNTLFTKKSSTVYVGLILFILLDLVLAWFQYYNFPLDGDLYAIVLPAPWYADVLGDPLGIRVWLDDASYSGAGRYFAHQTMEAWFKSVPFLLQVFVDPINSVYGSVALFKLLIHAGIAGVVGGYVCGHFRLRSTDYLLSSASVLPFVQTYTLYEKMGLVDHSITYVFFYIFPVLILLILLFPFYMFQISGRWNIRGWWWFPWIIGLLYVSHFGPMLQGLMLLTGSLILLAYWIHLGRQLPWNGIMQDLKKPFQSGIGMAVVVLFVFAAYGYLTGMANTENKEALPAIETYTRAIKGLNVHFFSQWHFYILAAWWVSNTFLLHYFRPAGTGQFSKIYLFLLVFSICYLILIPFGGYRPYRPLIYRYDLLIPVTLIGIFLLLNSSRFLLKALKGIQRTWYLWGCGVLLLTFTGIDVKVKQKNRCEKTQLEKLANTQRDTVVLSGRCPVMSWEIDDNTYFTDKRVKMMRYWNIVEGELTYIQEKN